MTLPARCDDSGPPFGTLVFDCDSTLSAIEGIDELAGARKPEISALTTRAMAGEIKLEDVYAKRLELLKPDRAAVEELGRKYVAARLPHAGELVAALHALEKRVVILSGALRQALLPLAEILGIPEANVYAVEVYHDRAGHYAGFDELSPLARSGGKLGVMRDIARADRKGGVAFVGDGITDLEAAPAARRFVAFGGVVKRKEVFERAAVSCDRPDLAALLPLLVANDELERLARSRDFAPLVIAARNARR
jgi:phosphoserine phosphatase